jgi:hypothetical protein
MGEEIGNLGAALSFSIISTSTALRQQPWTGSTLLRSFSGFPCVHSQLDRNSKAFPRPTQLRTEPLNNIEIY